VSSYVHYPAMIMLAAVHVLAVASIPYMMVHGVGHVELTYHVAAYLAGGLGITALYHRSWAHGSVRFARSVEYVLASSATFVLQMPARQWISTHIKHHQHTDKDKDPYDITKGFWWAHFEWIIFAPVPKIEIPTRLVGHTVMEWQERYYWLLSGLLNVVVPTIIAVAVGAPWWGGLLVSALRVVVMCHVVFAVNSICHFWGARPFTLDVSARDVWWFPFALGEQYHNYHHAFPRDYRHGIRSWDFDPTKWFIMLLARLGLASGLVAMPATRVAEAKQTARGGGL